MSNNNSIEFICSGLFETLKLEFNSRKDNISLEVRKFCGGMTLQYIHKTGSGEVLYELDWMKDFLSKNNIRLTEIR